MNNMNSTLPNSSLDGLSPNVSLIMGDCTFNKMLCELQNGTDSPIFSTPFTTKAVEEVQQNLKDVPADDDVKNSSYSLTPYLSMGANARKRRWATTPGAKPKLASDKISGDIKAGKTEQLKLEFELKNLGQFLTDDDEDCQAPLGNNRVLFVKAFNKSVESEAKLVGEGGQKWSIKVWVRMQRYRRQNFRRFFKQKRIGVFLQSDPQLWPDILYRCPVSARILLESSKGQHLDKIGTFCCDFGKQLHNFGFENWLGEKELLANYAKDDTLRIRVEATVGKGYYDVGVNA